MIITETRMPPVTNDDYDNGFQDGLRCFAINKDGKTFVGSSGVTLTEAIATRTGMWSYFSEKKQP